MSSIDFIGLKRILENKNEDIITICTTLTKILGNILAKPNELETRRLNLDNDDVVNNLMPYSGGLEILFEIGFEEESESFFLPLSVNDEKISAVKKKIESILIEKQNLKSSESIQACSTNPISAANKPKIDQKQNNNKFALKLQSSFDHVIMYEDSALKQKALNSIPVERLKKEAEAKFDSYKSNLESKPYDLNDFLALELLQWFKNEFFKWINQPDCEFCHSNQQMQFEHSDRPLGSEAVWLANNVEVYKCINCQKKTRFPRYNHPGKLLETRGGRCGEWANCFCLCLRALDFDARYILDWTDHVWCEIYSNSQKRWMHADPCENTIDKPLLYEHGWGKKLTYVIAFSRHEVVDVTWRYSSKHAEVLQRRNECDETWLAKYTSELSKRRQRTLNKSFCDYLQLRMVTEIVEFLTPKQVKEGEDIGRQSGSLQWRLNRGEIQLPTISAGFCFKINSTDLIGNKFSIRYNTVKDTYFFSNNHNGIKSWKEAAYSYSNIQFKKEYDWKMCYLARTQGSESSFIEWGFDLQGNKFEKIEIKCGTTCFEDGVIKLSLLSIEDNQNSDKLTLEKNNISHNSTFTAIWENDHFKVYTDKSFRLRADLTKGNGSNAWQHTQLFRQNFNETDKYQFEIIFYFK